MWRKAAAGHSAALSWLMKSGAADLSGVKPAFGVEAQRGYLSLPHTDICCQVAPESPPNTCHWWLVRDDSLATALGDFRLLSLNFAMTIWECIILTRQLSSFDFMTSLGCGGWAIPFLRNGCLSHLLQAVKWRIEMSLSPLAHTEFCAREPGRILFVLIWWAQMSEHRRFSKCVGAQSDVKGMVFFLKTSLQTLHKVDLTLYCISHLIWVRSL